MHETMLNEGLNNTHIKVYGNQCLPSICADMPPVDYALVQVMSLANNDDEHQGVLGALANKATSVYLNYDEAASFAYGVCKNRLPNLSDNVITQRTRCIGSSRFGLYNNHIRLLVTPNWAVVSTMDLSFPRYYRENREPLYFIQDPEIIEQLKVLFFNSAKLKGRYGSLDLTSSLGNRLIIDDGRGGRNNKVLSAANNFIANSCANGCRVTIVSSWFPDACIQSINKCICSGSSVEVVCLKPLSEKTLREAPFALTKLISHTYGSTVLLNKLNIVQVPDLHAKFIIAKKPDGSTSCFLSTCNLTSWGALARSEELAIITNNFGVGESLESFVTMYKQQI